MQQENEVKLPPPIRQPKQRLTLQRAMQAFNKSGERISLKNPATESALNKANAPAAPIMHPGEEIPAPRSGMEQEAEAYLLELQAEMIRREDALCDKENKLMVIERELNEKEALIEARRKVIESSIQANPDAVDDGVNHVELAALKKLKAELDAQEKALKESRESLRERERYVEECENALVTKSMELTEREAHVEQREEDDVYDQKAEA